MRFSSDKKYDFKILKAVEAVNEAQKRLLVRKMEAHFGSLKGKTIALWGLAFKPKTDDMREAPAIADRADAARSRRQGSGLRSGGHEGGARAFSARRSRYAAKSYDALRGADALAIVTEWHEFREPDFARMRKLMHTPVVFDGRNIYQPQQMKAHGFTYYSIGR